MNQDDIKALIESSIPESQVQAQIDGSHVHLVVVSPAFEGLMPVKKQQLVYACLQDSIASGAIHAVHMQTFTPAQWAEKQA
ncbi:BolA family protein [Saccharophagus degradans]|uniref:BolA-like protein n=2 Tax=Saccharophagus degradans TaxID=86304 RepID=Q21FV1_SACD2|nr:BolA/IbaG family iron-sulfur metabolism protein [Saccharophagus degradans]ABD82428.1 BolA-like protein [Saccharophagus degradans 2-40]MBU2985378.1 BolA/IbaG family iron-sulfur metabolism protein [Saccharophagus degradans]MDO6421459.1 BolA/IbaG family iron-sulfur metabolism protein [Saccharophagus degradans]MDO6608727.1 BolA/IbaG family iron-sulfur metabolism protein [Saccharophagus degradans]